jgi:hypothetical protein
MNRFIFEYNVDEKLSETGLCDAVIDALRRTIDHLSVQPLNTKTYVELSCDAGMMAGGYWVEQVPG